MARRAEEGARWATSRQLAAVRQKSTWVVGGRRITDFLSVLALDEDAFLAGVRAIPALADSDSPWWNQEEAWDDAYLLLVAADVIGEWGWVRAVVPVFERVAREGICTRPCGPERAAGAAALAALLEPLASHARAGTR